jgi:hypothetical protein
VWWEGKTWGFLECKESLGFPEAMQGKFARGVPKAKMSWQEEHPTNITERASDTDVVGRKNLGFPACKENLGFPEAMQGKLAREAPKTKPSWQEERPTNKTERASDRGVVGKKLGVSRDNARQVDKRGAQNQADLARGAPNQKNRKSQRQRCGGEKTWGFQRPRKASWQEGCPKPSRVGKRSAQPTKLKEPAIEVRWGKNLGFPEATQGELARGVPKTKPSWQEEHPTNKTERGSDRGAVGKKLGVSRGNARQLARGAPKTKPSWQEEHAQPTKPKEPATEVRWGKNLGFPEATQGELARGVPKTKPSWQEERPTNKTERASDRGVVGKNLGFPEETQGKMSRGSQNQAELASGAPNKQNRKGQ